MAKKTPAKNDKETNGSDPLKRQYPNPYLTNVIARVDFASPIDLPDKGPPSSILTPITAIYPIYEEDMEIEATITVGGAVAPQPQTPRKVIKLWSKDRNKWCTLGRDHIALEYKKYQSFSVMTGDFNTVFNPVVKRFTQVHAKRVGLRYVNSIDLKDETDVFDWSKYLAETLTATLGDPKDLLRSFHVIERNHGDFRSKLQYGMMNPDYPAPIKRKIFIIDTDHVNDNVLDPDEVRRTLPEMHKAAKLLFESVIKDGLREKMRKKP